jgi:hypothetical protein
MILFLVCLFVVAVAIGSYVALAIAGALFGAGREQPAASARSIRG